ncbi:hypothetical protein B0T10DRAFT_102683 [Thelonectria olida]|uniref:C2H2-type domain-containing protein n=1 Tax=Thelonectria olida TaxID=1576542 RepID=A0A9P8WFX7_9HYPO|nr:hypothetical protein B0T10DRAFT_102683 [Thelonectria olida]
MNPTEESCLGQNTAASSSSANGRQPVWNPSSTSPLDNGPLHGYYENSNYFLDGSGNYMSQDDSQSIPRSGSSPILSPANSAVGPVLQSTSHPTFTSQYPLGWSATSQSQGTSDSPAILSSTPMERPHAARRGPPGTRRCDIRRRRNRIIRPEACPVCEYRAAERRDVNRHLRSVHPEEARARGMSVDRIKCIYLHCPTTFARLDHRRRHLENVNSHKGLQDLTLR